MTLTSLPLKLWTPNPEPGGGGGQFPGQSPLSGGVPLGPELPAMAVNPEP